jgi:hypothetical protein
MCTSCMNLNIDMPFLSIVVSIKYQYLTIAFWKSLAV